MFRNYLTVAWRTLLRNRLFSAINIAGLAIGLCVCGLIYCYIQFERSYDTYNVNGDRLYRVTISSQESNGSFNQSAANHPAVAPAMKADFPEVETFARLAKTNFFVNSITLSSQDKQGNLTSFNEEKMFLADGPFLTMFSYPLVEGDAASALVEKNSVVITESLKKKFFGEEPGLGKQLSLNREVNLTITGVLKDIPENSHLSFNALVSFSSVGENWGYDQWRWPEFYNYVLLKPGVDAKNVTDKFPGMVDKYLGDVVKEYKWDIKLHLQPIKSIHLTSNLSLEQDVNGSERVVYFLGLLGIFILVVAWINYINLSTAKSLERSKEVGLRKVVGANRTQLIIQFFFDAFLVNFLALITAACFLMITLPLFEQLVGKHLSTVLFDSHVGGSAGIWMLAVGILITGTLLVGSYPALLLSSFNPALVLKGKFYKSSSGQLLRKGLVTFQYALSIFLIAGTIIMYRQMAFMQKQDLGYNKDQILVIKSPAVFDSTLANHVTFFKNELERVSAVKNSAASDGIPGRVLLARNGIRKQGLTHDADFNCFQQSVDKDFFDTYQMKLLSGRSFSEKDIFSYDHEAPLIVNESLIHQLGFQNPEEAIHQKVSFGMGPREQHGEIVGVIKDYHQVSLKSKYEPMMFLVPEFTAWGYFSVNLEAGNMRASIDEIRGIYDKAFPNNAFEYFFLDEFFNRQYAADVQLGSIFGIFTGLAIVIACLGLLGLSIFAVIHRTKEVGIRKVLGASVLTILSLFSADFLKLLAVAYVVATPLVYIAAQKWLSAFAFHVTPGWELFVVPLMFLTFISLSTVGLICFRAATANPTSSLRQE
ncbi:ABC transporter permease [Chryseolinea sp. T2]|uniref:ABC transporter permease n=1 Tax=Chryseolinea sp. T2 TaxID=3129255 RepID=UPI00307775B9